MPVDSIRAVRVLGVLKRRPMRIPDAQRRLLSRALIVPASLLAVASILLVIFVLRISAFLPHGMPVQWHQVLAPLGFSIGLIVFALYLRSTTPAESTTDRASWSPRVVMRRRRNLKAIDRGRKLEAMANRGATAPERELAQTRLKEHLARHGLSPADLAEESAPRVDIAATPDAAAAEDLPPIFADDEAGPDRELYAFLIFVVAMALLAIYSAGSGREIEGTVTTAWPTSKGKAAYVSVRLDDGETIAKRVETDELRRGSRVAVTETTGILGSKHYRIEALPNQPLD